MAENSKELCINSYYLSETLEAIFLGFAYKVSCLSVIPTKAVFVITLRSVSQASFMYVSAIYISKLPLCAIDLTGSFVHIYVV